MARLRELSPVSASVSYYVARWRREAGRWMLYHAIPQRMIHADRRAQLSVWWEDLPVGQQAGRRQSVSAYQYQMYQDHQLDVRPFLILQGERGATPARYLDREKKVLAALQLPTVPPALGSLAYAPFDERTVARILERDRLVKANQNLEMLAKINSGAGQRAEDGEAETAYRRAILAYWSEAAKPQAELLADILGKTHEGKQLRRATQREAYAANHFQEHFLETGEVPGATLPELIRG